MVFVRMEGCVSIQKLTVHVHSGGKEISVTKVEESPRYTGANSLLTLCPHRLQFEMGKSFFKQGMSNRVRASLSSANTMLFTCAYSNV